MLGTDTSAETSEGSHRGVSDMHKSDTVTPNLDDTFDMVTDDESEESVSEDGKTQSPRSVTST